MQTPRDKRIQQLCCHIRESIPPSAKMPDIIIALSRLLCDVLYVTGMTLAEAHGLIDASWADTLKERAPDAPN